MARPDSSSIRAKSILARFYEETGILPSVQKLASLLGMTSTASAHYVVGRLREEGFLGSDEHGKLTPGPLFSTRYEEHSIPHQVLSLLPKGPDITVVTVDNRWELDSSVQEGDHLFLAPAATAPEDSSLYVLKRNERFMLACEPKGGWRTVGAVVGQYRRHGPS